MNISIQSAAPELASKLALLTHSAELVPSAISYDKQSATISIPMTRKHYLRKRLFWGFGERYQRVSPESTQSVLLVRDVLEYKSDNRLSLPTITLLFGVKLTNNELYLCSMEETKGIVAFELLIKIRSYDIELRDKD